MIVEQLDDDLTIHRLVTPEDVARWRASFIGTYQTVFSGFPYFERFFPSEAEGVYRKLTSTPDNITLIAAHKESSIVAFGVAIPLRFKKDVAVQLTGLVPVQHTFYLAELGVLESWRGHGLGRALIRERLRLIDPTRWSHIVLRVSTQNTSVSELYRAMGFEDMGVYQEISSMRVDGKVRSDRRFFMSRVLSQVPISGGGG